MPTQRVQVVKKTEVNSAVAGSGQTVNLKGETGTMEGAPFYDKDRSLDCCAVRMDQDGVLINMPLDRVSTKIRGKLTFALSSAGRAAWERIFGAKKAGSL